MEIRTEMKVVAYLEEMMCDDCDKGKMALSYYPILMSHPPQYQHICDSCSVVKNYPKSYPNKVFDIVLIGDVQ